LSLNQTVDRNNLREGKLILLPVSEFQPIILMKVKGAAHIIAERKQIRVNRRDEGNIQPPRACFQLCTSSNHATLSQFHHLPTVYSNFESING
jgi:hypothetical protein